MLRHSTVNKALTKFGDIELINGEGYFYFVGDAVSNDVTGVYVNNLNMLTLEQWLEEAQAAIKKETA